MQQPAPGKGKKLQAAATRAATACCSPQNGFDKAHAVPTQKFAVI